MERARDPACDALLVMWPMIRIAMTVPTINPVGVEVCDGEDNNCDGLIDDASASDATLRYIDDDSDGEGSDASQRWLAHSRAAMSPTTMIVMIPTTQ